MKIKTVRQASFLFVAAMVCTTLLPLTWSSQRKGIADNWFPKQVSDSQKFPKDLAEFLHSDEQTANKNWRLYRFPLHAGIDDGYFLLGYGPEECAPVGNCSFMVTQKKNGKFRKLLSTSMVQRFRVLSTTHNGVFDIEARSHGSAFVSGFVLYRFNNMRYYAARCGDISYRQPREDEDPNTFDAGSPETTYHRCNPR